MKYCYIYTRTATETQATNLGLNSLDCQEIECLNYAYTHSYKVLEVYKEIGSGLHINPQLEGLLNVINNQPEHVNAVVISSIDRLSRDYKTLSLVSELFKKHKIALLVAR